MRLFGSEEQDLTINLAATEHTVHARVNDCLPVYENSYLQTRLHHNNS